MIMDKLAEAVAARGPVCVGLDTAPEYLPPRFRAGFEDPAEAVFQFNRRIIDATAHACACYKLQIAYYEALGLSGMRAYSRTLQYVHATGRLAIADVKRGDIAATAAMYAAAHFSGDFEADFVTLSPYMGMDSIEPWLPWVREHEKGLFVLIRTSNPGAVDIQYLEEQSGERVYTQVARRVAALGQPRGGGARLQRRGRGCGLHACRGGTQPARPAVQHILPCTRLRGAGRDSAGHHPLLRERQRSRRQRKPQYPARLAE